MKKDYSNTQSVWENTLVRVPVPQPVTRTLRESVIAPWWNTMSQGTCSILGITHVVFSPFNGRG